MSFEPTGPGGVKTPYGTNPVGAQLVGCFKHYDAERRLVVDLNPETLANGLFLDTILPANSLPVEVVITITEAFAITGGASNKISIGTKTSEATNGFDIAEATLEAVGTTTSTTFNGTWAASLAAATTVGAAFSGGGTVDTSVGKGTVELRYEVL